MLHYDMRSTQYKLLECQRPISRFNGPLLNRGYQKSGGHNSSDRSWSPPPNPYIHPSKDSRRMFDHSSEQSFRSSGLNSLSRKLLWNCKDSEGDAAAQGRLSSSTNHDEHTQSLSASGVKPVRMQQIETVPTSGVPGVADRPAMFDNHRVCCVMTCGSFNRIHLHPNIPFLDSALQCNIGGMRIQVTAILLIVTSLHFLTLTSIHLKMHATSLTGLLVSFPGHYLGLVNTLLCVSCFGTPGFPQVVPPLINRDFHPLVILKISHMTAVKVPKQSQDSRRTFDHSSGQHFRAQPLSRSNSPSLNSPSGDIDAQQHVSSSTRDSLHTQSVSDSEDKQIPLNYH
ncbi:hypothetical protein SNE40_002974 [Patella caerulea]|uniref:Uncharacterized protein n=1 Tax=Patella caerulea TaxID=87958 RepID=A0AAN8PZU0_PATCE